MNRQAIRPPVRHVQGLAAVADGYDGFVIDLWGVLHDGATPYPGAIEALQALRERKKQVGILSNGPRRAAAVAARCSEIGIAPDLYDYLHCSGEETWLRLRHRADPWYGALGRRAYLVMSERDRGLLDGLDIAPAASLAEADFLLVTGTERAKAAVSDYETILAEGAARRLPMVCANPDLEVIHRGGREICAGALAQRYEALGGAVRYEGKPHRDVYDRCLANFATLDRRRILAIGDSLRTDIAGAAGTGLDSLLIVGGIHGEELAGGPGGSTDGQQLAAACARWQAWPTYVIDRFRWRPPR